jgi:glycosyltransferase involved in cell wall biosynthesis
MEKLVADLDLAASVDFLGRLATRADVLDLLLECHLYALPTLRDGPPVAILEAMSLGLPILCLDHGATRELVPDDGGFKVPLHSRQQVVDGLAAAIGVAGDDLPALHERGLSARRYAVEVHDWNRIGDTIDRIYRELMATSRS